jgi:hypothetical protein
MRGIIFRLKSDFVGFKIGPQQSWFTITTVVGFAHMNYAKTSVDNVLRDGLEPFWAWDDRGLLPLGHESTPSRPRPSCFLFYICFQTRYEEATG